MPVATIKYALSFVIPVFYLYSPKIGLFQTSSVLAVNTKALNQSSGFPLLRLKSSGCAVGQMVMADQNTCADALSSVMEQWARLAY